MTSRCQRRYYPGLQMHELGIASLWVAGVQPKTTTAATQTPAQYVLNRPDRLTLASLLDRNHAVALTVPHVAFAAWLP